MRNLREYLDVLAETGHLKTIEQETDWSIEASAFTAVSCREAGPALHFRNVKDYSGKGGLAGGLFAGPGTLYLERFHNWTRLCLGLGLDADAAYPDFLHTCMKRFENPILPILLDSAPVKEVVTTGDAVDVTSLPVPYLHRQDGGRYGTLQTMVVQNPDSGQVIWENVRTMVVDKRQLTVHLEEHSRVKELFDTCPALKRSIPCALVMGGSPAVTATGFLPSLTAADPAAMAGGLNLEPIELVPAETSDLLVPGEAEVIIEGRVDPAATAPAGPFPDYWMYKGKQEEPVLHVTAITHRKNPVVPFSVDGVKPGDTHTLKSLMLSYSLYNRLVHERNFPVKWVQLPLEFNLNIVVICSPIPFPGYVSMLSKFVLSLSRQFGSLWNKVIVVDEKTPANSLETTIAIIIQRTNCREGFHFWDGLPIGPNARYASAEQRKKGATSGLYVDTGWPKDWAEDDIPRKCDLEGSFPEEMIRDIAEKYNDLGFKGKPVIFDEAIAVF